MKTRFSLFAAFGALAAFGPACADEIAVRDAAGIEVIVVTAKRLATPAEADIVASALRALSAKKPEIALPEIEVRLERLPKEHG